MVQSSNSDVSDQSRHGKSEPENHGLADARNALVTPSDVRPTPAGPQAPPSHLDLSHHNLYHHHRHQGHGKHHEAGSPIKGDGSEQKHHIGNGETLGEIARQQLGKHASKHDVDAQIDAIVRANHGKVAGRDKIIAGTDIVLPKFDLHGTGSGAEQPVQGERTNGQRRQGAGREQATGQGEQATVQREKVTGQGEKVTGGDQGQRRGDQQQELQPQPKPADLAAEKQKLLADLDNPEKNKGMSPEQIAQTKADMAKLEARAQASGNMDQDVAQTYQQMSRLLEADPSKAKVNNPQLLGRLVEQIAHQAADSSIDQGNHNTCNVTTIGDVTFTKHPGEAAEAIATTALTGQWRNPADGKVSTIPEGSLKPGAEENRDQPLDGQRSYATQLLNLALVNDQTQRRNPPQFYSQEQPERGNQNQSDTGERLRYANGSEVMRNEKVVVVDADGRPTTQVQERPARSPSLTCQEIEQIGERLGDGKQLLITNPDVVGADPSEAQPRNAQELAAILADKKAHGKLPAVVMVDANNPEFGGSGTSPNGGRWHVLTVTGYDPATGDVSLSNQWGKKSHNMHVTVQRLNQMMQQTPPDQ